MPARIICKGAHAVVSVDRQHAAESLRAAMLRGLPAVSFVLMSSNPDYDDSESNPWVEGGQVTIFVAHVEMVTDA